MTRIREARIQEFWRWFVEHSTELEDTSQQLRIDRLLTPQIKRLHKELDYELGPGKRSPNMLTLSSKSNRALRGEAARIIAAAPSVADWEFYDALQPHEIPPEIIVDENIRFETSNWRFSMSEDASTGKFDITIVDDFLASVHATKPNAAFCAVFVMLDSLLGEDVVETRVGDINVAGHVDGLGETHQMPELVALIAKRTI